MKTTSSLAFAAGFAAVCAPGLVLALGCGIVGGIVGSFVGDTATTEFYNLIDAEPRLEVRF